MASDPPRRPLFWLAIGVLAALLILLLGRLG